jgi:hypothetical protein
VPTQQHDELDDEENKEMMVTCTKSGKAKAPYFHIEVVAELPTLYSCFNYSPYTYI